jgi:hypothetical protein
MENYDSFFDKKYHSTVDKNKLNCEFHNVDDDHPSARVLMNQIIESKNNNNIKDNNYVNNNNISENEKNEKQKDSNVLLNINLKIPK